MSDRTRRFVEVSARLTGFSPVDLHGTGMVDVYAQTVEDAGVLDDLLGAADPDGDAARDVILLWYCGTWRGETVSADAYIAGLQWAAAGAHPVGGRAQGYGAWAVPPQSATP
ncbi:MAG TPA: hypothetical protein VHJ34_02345 [Actinomycetota bacterium]|nr:hypothetical protein [Actinomycetota bacterium]